jgi:hypothetical protein
MKPQDQDARVQRASHIEYSIIEVLLALIHQGKLRELGVGKIADLANALMRSRGEILEYRPDEVGWKLKALSLFRHRRSSGSLLILDRETSIKVHALARTYVLPSLRVAVEGCPDCAATQISVQ